MSASEEVLPTDPRRVRAFVSFFKNYMGVSSMVVAALPVPVTALRALPTFADQRASLSIYTSLFCFLVLGFIFYTRRVWAALMFPRVMRAGLRTGGRAAGYTSESEREFWASVLPLALICAAAGFCYQYNIHIDRAVLEIASSPEGQVADLSSPAKVLERSYLKIPYGDLLRPLYVGMFVCAEAAFILMATREYIQDLLQLSDRELIVGRRNRRDAASANDR